MPYVQRGQVKDRSVFKDQLTIFIEDKINFFSQNDVSARIVNQLLTEMAGVEERKGVFILAATNRPDVVDPAILRPGRLDKIIYVGLPTSEDRVDILKTITKNGEKIGLSEDVDLEIIGRSEKLFGFTGADLFGLVQEACRSYVKRTWGNNEIENYKLTKQDFEKAMSKIKASVSDTVRHFEYSFLFTIFSEQYEAAEINNIEENIVHPSDKSKNISFFYNFLAINFQVIFILNDNTAFSNK